MTLYQFALYVLATYFICFSIVRLDGPFDLMTFIRSHIDPNQKTWVGRGLNCPICVSFWIGAILALVLGATWLEWLGACGVIIIINKVVMQ